MKPGERRDRIVHAGGKEMRRSEPITDGGKGHARRRERRRHERHPFLVAVGPAAAMHKGQQRPVGRRRAENRKTLIGIFAVALVGPLETGAELHDLVAIGATVIGRRLLGRIFV